MMVENVPSEQSNLSLVLSVAVIFRQAVLICVCQLSFNFFNLEAVRSQIRMLWRQQYYKACLCGEFCYCYCCWVF